VEPSRQLPCDRTEAYNYRLRAIPHGRSGVTGLAIAGNPENDAYLSPWQEAVGHEIIPDTHKNGRANEATTGLTLGLFVMLFQASPSGLNTLHGIAVDQCGDHCSPR
jgi:hypothetical protein